MLEALALITHRCTHSAGIEVEQVTDEFVRVRFGVGRPPDGWESADYVLGRFAADEQSLIREAVAKAAASVANQGKAKS